MRTSSRDPAPSDRTTCARVRAVLLGLPRAARAPVNVDVDRTVSEALVVWDAVRRGRPTLEAEVRAFPATTFDAGLLDVFEPLSYATKLAARQVALHRATRSQAILSADTKAEVRRVERRFRILLQYGCGDDPELAARLRHLRRLGGHVGLVARLLGYVELYGERTPLMVQDGLHDPRLPEVGRDLARRIEAARRRGPDRSLEIWMDARDRAWALWLTVWDDLRAAARFVLRGTPAARRLVPARALVRRRLRRR